jgi:hypothetical protein
MLRCRSLVALAIVFASWTVPAPAHATVITFVATDLPEALNAPDRWQYTYVVSGRTFSSDQGFVVLFDHSLYDNLSAGAPTPPDWEVVVGEPIPALLSPGFFDALALTSNPSALGPFVVSFDWLGSGVPESQPFDVYELVGRFPDVFESGFTRPAAVPEPSLLLLIAGAGLGMRRVRLPARR